MTDTFSDDDLLLIAKLAFSNTVDIDLAGNPITDYTVLTSGPYRNALVRALRAIAVLCTPSDDCPAETPDNLPHAVASIPLLNPGEKYAGIIFDKDNENSYHVALLPGEFIGKWEDAKEWALQAGGVLPSRREQLLLFINLKNEFKRELYWGDEINEDYSALVTAHDFHRGISTKYVFIWNRLYYARAVRRIPA